MMLGTVRNMQRTRKKILLIMLCLLFLFISLEILVRLFWEPQIRTYEKGMLIKDNDAGFALKPGFEGYILGKTGEDLKIPVKINSKGLRDDEANYTKPANFRRILALGDTITFGMRVPYDETSMRLLEKNLSNEGYRVEIINLAVPAYDHQQEYIRYKTEGYKYSPDIVLIIVAMNDILPSDIESLKRTFDLYQDFYVPDKPSEVLIKKVCQSCVFLYSLYYNRHAGFTNRGYLRHVYSQWDNETAWNDYSSALLNFNSELKSQNRTLLIAMYPYIIQMDGDENYGRLPQKKMAMLANENNITFIDVAPSLNNEKYKEFFTPEGKAASWKGHKKIAEEILAKLKEKGILISQVHK